MHGFSIEFSQPIAFKSRVERTLSKSYVADIAI